MHDDQRLPDAQGDEPWMFEGVDPSAGRAAAWVLACVVASVLAVFVIMVVLA